MRRFCRKTLFLNAAIGLQYQGQYARCLAHVFHGRVPIHVDGAEDEREHRVALSVFFHELLRIDGGSRFAVDFLLRVDGCTPCFEHLVCHVQFLFVYFFHGIV